MDLNFYRFQSEWDVEAEPSAAYLALEALQDYPAWWREVRTARRIDGEMFEIFVRALLPYGLRFTATAIEQDPERGVLEIRMEGDLEGFSRWTITPNGRGSRLRFDEEVVANKLLLRRLSAVARPVFKANHALMMRNCRKGLNAYLAGVRRALETAPRDGHGTNL